MQRTILRLILLATAICISCLGTLAQQDASKRTEPEVDLAFTYSAVRSNLTTGSNFWLQGGGAELSATVYRGFGVTAAVTGAYANNISPTGVDLTMIITTFGPRYAWSHKLSAHRDRKLVFFGHGLIGESNGIYSVFPNPGGAQSSANSFALQVGGGADIDVSRHFAIRLLQADWFRTQFPNGTTSVQNNLRLGAGVVIRIRMR